jgi:hypothetical protein
MAGDNEIAPALFMAGAKIAAAETHIFPFDLCNFFRKKVTRACFERIALG